MFIREIGKKNAGSDKVFVCHRLVQSVRTPRGPRQRVVMNLGKVDLPKEQWKQLADRIEEIVHGQSQRLIAVPAQIEALAQHYAQLLIKKRLAEKGEEASTEQEPDFQSVDVNGVCSSETKSIGPEHVGLEAMKGLGFFDLFKHLGLSKTQSDLAAMLIVGRLVHPSSERELIGYARERSGLDELLGTDFSHMSQNALYRASDLLIDNREQIERFLRKRSQGVFSLKETIILYDLTNTYFAGQARAYDKAKRGKSKQKRNDRPLVTLGLVLDEEGFLKQSRVLEGNVSEPSTLLSVVRSIHENIKEERPPLLVSKPTVVLDAGIATKDNVDLLKEEGFSYIVVSRSNPDEDPEQEFVQIKEGIKAKSIQQGEELFLHCVSEARMEKEKAMVATARDRMHNEVKSVAEGLHKKGCVKVYGKILERIGRIRQRYARVSKGFSITVKEHEGKATELTWQFDESKLSKPYDGSYFVRTNRTDLCAEKIWSIYVMLTSVEDAFRCLKSELGLRPVHHSKANRIEAHLFISVLAYHLLNYIQYYLRNSGLRHRWPTIQSCLETHEVLSTTLPKENGGMIHLRYCTIPTAKQREIYQALRITDIPLKRKKVVT
jgi:transposase